MALPVAANCEPSWGSTLMVTVLDDPDAVERAVGATDYITKPIPWAVLRHRVRHLPNPCSLNSYSQPIESWSGQLSGWL